MKRLRNCEIFYVLYIMYYKELNGQGFFAVNLLHFGRRAKYSFLEANVLWLTAVL